MWSRYLALGDSVTEGVGDDVGDLECRSWADWMVDGLRVTTPDLEYRNVSSAGATASTVLSAQIQEIERFGPDLVSLTVGANDARVPGWTASAFEAELTSILESAANVGAQVMTATYADVETTIKQAGGEIRDSWRLYFDRMHEVNAVIRKVGERFDARLVDMESTEANDARYLSRDMTHPNALAYRLIGQTALKVVTAR
jgi:lysophospholipase L1-like esterase